MTACPKLEGAVTGQAVSFGSVVGLGLSLQGFYDSLNLPREALKGRDHFEIFERCSLSESYLKSDLSVVLDLAIQGHPSPVEIGSDEHDGVSVDRPVFMLQFHSLDSGDRKHWNQEMMFVVNVEIVEGENIAVPSLVTLHSVEHEFNNRGRFWYRSAFRKRGLKFVACPFGINRELPVLGRRAVPQGVNCSAPHNIESASEIVNCIANDQCDIGAQFPISRAVVEDMFPRLAIHVQAGAVSVRRGVESVLDIRDVLVGPFDL